jgi:hypothetical protein
MLPWVRRRAKAVLRSQDPNALRRLQLTEPLATRVLTAMVSMTDLPVSRPFFLPSPSVFFYVVCV